MKSLYFCLALGIVLTLACQPAQRQQVSDDTPGSGSGTEMQDPLPSWHDGPVKQDILSFVEHAVEMGHPGYIPVEDRIATFDNDGNLWSEQPAYFQLFFAIDRVKAMAPDHPEWHSTQPYQAVLEGDLETLKSLGEHGLAEIVMTTHAGMTTEAFEQIVTDWMSTARHPRFEKRYDELIYQPMLELLNFLRANEFKTFIVSGGGIEFMRPWAEKAYGIPKDQIVGSSIKTEFRIEEGVPVIRRLPAIDFIDDKEGKPVGINRFIGRRPVFASGNSDGDLQMLQWTMAGKGPRFALYLHHTDAEREWAYDRESSIGRLDKGLDEARARGWTVIDMAKDWKVIYPFQLEQAE